MISKYIFILYNAAVIKNYVLELSGLSKNSNRMSHNLHKSINFTKQLESLSFFAT